MQFEPTIYTYIIYELLFALITAMTVLYTMGTISMNYFEFYVSTTKLIISTILALIIFFIDCKWNSKYLNIFLKTEKRKNEKT